MGVIRVVHVPVAEEPRVVEVEGEAGIAALLGGLASSRVMERRSHRRAEPPVAVYAPVGAEDGEPNYWPAGAQDPERGPRVIALLGEDGRKLRSMGEIDGECWLWRIARWRFELQERRG